MRKLFVACLFVLSFVLVACGSAEPVAVVLPEPTVEPTVEPTEVPLPVDVGERGKLSLLQTKVEIKQGECSLPVVELEALVSDLRFNFLPQNSDNPLNNISPCIGGTQYGSGSGSGKFGISAPLTFEPGTYQIEIKVFIWVDQHPGEYLTLPLTVVVTEKE